MKVRLIIESDEITIITEDGGVACIREAEDVDDTPRSAVTDYYHMRLTELPAESKGESPWDYLAEGKMSCNDWEDTPFNDSTLIAEALNWLAPTEPSFQFTNELFAHIDF